MIPFNRFIKSKKKNKTPRPVEGEYIYFPDESDGDGAFFGELYKLDPYELVEPKSNIDRLGAETGVSDLDELKQVVVTKGKLVRVAIGEDMIELGVKGVEKKDQWYIVGKSFPPDHSHRAYIL